jgi:hypothetical protein
MAQFVQCRPACVSKAHAVSYAPDLATREQATLPSSLLPRIGVESQFYVCMAWACAPDLSDRRRTAARGADHSHTDERHVGVVGDYRLVVDHHGMSSRTIDAGRGRAWARVM